MLRQACNLRTCNGGMLANKLGNSFGCAQWLDIISKRNSLTILGNVLNFSAVSDSEDNTREAQDTPVISVESNRNETETKVEPTKPRKVNKGPKASKILEGSVANVTPATTSTNEDVTTEASSASGILVAFPNSFLLSHT